MNHLYVFSSPSSILNLGVQPRFNILDESSNFLGFPSGLEASANSPEKLSKFFIFSAASKLISRNHFQYLKVFHQYRFQLYILQHKKDRLRIEIS